MKQVEETSSTNPLPKSVENKILAEQRRRGIISGLWYWRGFKAITPTLREVKLKFSKHALDQLKIRNRITKNMAQETVASPDQVLNSFRSRKLFQKTYNGETLEVVVVEEDNKLAIITQYFLESV